MFAVDGPTAALMEFLEEFRLIDRVEVLGPVDLPAGEELPAMSRSLTPNGCCCGCRLGSEESPMSCVPSSWGDRDDATPTLSAYA